MEGLTLGLGIIRLELMTSTMSRWHSTAELYPFPTLIWKENWLINNKLSRGRETQNNSLFSLEQLEDRPSFFSHYYEKKKKRRKKIVAYVNPIESSISYWFES